MPDTSQPKPTMETAPQNEANGPLSPRGNEAMALAWIVLFAFRWMGVPVLVLNGLLPPERIVTLDTALEKIYILLGGATLVVLILRRARRTGAVDETPAPHPDSRA